MNRTLIFGIVAFLAIVGITLTGGEKQAVAGHGCNGCSCAADSDGCDAKCDADDACSGKCKGRRCSGKSRGGEKDRCSGRSGRCHKRSKGCDDGCAAPADGEAAA